MSEFPTEYQRWRRKAIAAGYPRCTRCNEPVQKEYQARGTICRLCTKREVEMRAEEERWREMGGMDAVRYEQGKRP